MFCCKFGRARFLIGQKTLDNPMLRRYNPRISFETEVTSEPDRIESGGGWKPRGIRPANGPLSAQRNARQVFCDGAQPLSCGGCVGIFDKRPDSGKQGGTADEIRPCVRCCTQGFFYAAKPNK